MKEVGYSFAFRGRNASHLGCLKPMLLRLLVANELCTIRCLWGLAYFVYPRKSTEISDHFRTKTGCMSCLLLTNDKERVRRNGIDNIYLHKE